MGTGGKSAPSGALNLGNADPDPAALDTAPPIEWPAGGAGVDTAYIRRLAARLRACARREPELLPVCGVSRASVAQLAADARAVFRAERTVEVVHVPRTGPAPALHVLGDLHGDYFSLLAALDIAGLPSAENRLVLAGDLIDRGAWGCELVILVCALKVWRPRAVCVLRGNHETTECASSYGFRAECVRKFGGEKLFRSFMACFRELPLACVLKSLPPGGSSSAGRESRERRSELCAKKAGSRKSSRVKAARAEADPAGEEWERPCVPGERRALVVHGGLWREHPTRKGSMTIGSLRQLSQERRQVDNPEGSIVEDVLWSDPGLPTEVGVSANSLRGAGIFYGQGAVDAFLKREHLCLLIRAHEGPDARKKRPSMGSMLDGYSVDQERLISIFTAADYCGYGNRGAIATFNGLRPSSSELPDFKTFPSDKPVNAAVFYDVTGERPATPRSL